MKKKTTVQSVNEHSTPPAEETKIQDGIGQCHQSRYFVFLNLSLLSRRSRMFIY